MENLNGDAKVKSALELTKLAIEFHYIPNYGNEEETALATVKFYQTVLKNFNEDITNK